MTCVVQTPSDQKTEASEVEDPYRSMLREAIQEGLSHLRWAWLQSVAPALREELGTDNISSMLVKSIIGEADAKGHWDQGWCEAQLTAARRIQRVCTPRSRHRFVARGEQTGNAKLTAHKVRAIRSQYAARYKRLEEQQKTTIKHLAVKFDVDPITIRRILHRETWKHIP